MTAGYTDFHSHLVPGVDDGAQDRGMSAGALTEFRRAGVTQVIVTPHCDGSLTHHGERLAARLAELDAGWKDLTEVAGDLDAGGGLPMRIERGAEVMLDVPDPVLDDSRLRLAGTRFVLVEYQGLRLPAVNAAMAVGMIRRAGWIPVVAHPERYRNVESLAPFAELMDAGALLQVNAGSLPGDYGQSAQRLAAEILAAGMASFVCADYHARGEPATLRFARALQDAGFAEQADLLLGVNPGRLLDDQMPLPVPPTDWRSVPGVPWWKRMFGR